jgi:poly(3-hydroxybutyrate) depolymerase
MRPVRPAWLIVFGLSLLASGLLPGCGSGDGDRGDAVGPQQPGGNSYVPPGAAGGSGGTAGATPVDPLSDEGIDSTGQSAGCGLASPAQGELTLDVDGQAGQYLVWLPTGYDPARAYPLLFAFHGANRTNLDCYSRDCLGVDLEFRPDAITVYMKSFAAGWPDLSVREANVKFFSTLLGKIKAEYCVDQSRVEVTGTSSGATFSNILGCRFGDQIQSISPIAGTPIERENCVGRVAAMVVHGVDDNQVPFADGEAARDFWAARNNCTTTTVPAIADVHAQVRAARDQAMSTFACAEYQGCDAGYPVRWCEHSEGGYDNSTHGWPSFGGELVHAFVMEL